MKKNKFRKALLKVLFSCFCCAFTLGVATACKNNTPDTSSNSGAIVETLDIVDWEDETAEGVLGNCWDVEILKAFDTVGKEYPVNITVKKLANGAEIPLIYNAFDLLSTGGYEIIYTAGSGKDIAIKKITITVKDEVNPVIIVTGNNIAEIGKKYTYPTLNVNDDSGEACNVKVKVFNEKDELVESDATGFVPAEVGYYTLLIEAFDASNNSNRKTFEVYARNSIGIGEIDSFDDEGLQYTARVDTVYGEYTSFKHLSTSKGSAMFASSKAITTDVYVIPRIKAADLKGIDGDLCITISLYINDSSVEKKEVTVGTTKFDIETNKWTYLYVTEDDVSDIARFVTDLSHETKCLLSAQNNGTPYEIFIDEVSVCQKAEMQAVTGLESVYEQGASITFTLAEGYTLDWYRDGKVAAVASGSKLDVAGKYQAFARPVNGVGAVQMYEFTVGTLRMELQSDVKFAIGADNQLPEVKVYNGKTLVSDATVTYYDFGLYTGEMTKLEGTVKPEDVKFAIYAEAEVDGKIVSDVMFYTAKYTADAYAYMGEGNGDWAPTDSDFARQYGDYEGAYDNFDIIGNYAYYIESYGAAPSIRFTSLKAYMANKNIPTATIKILFAAPSSVAYDFGEGRSAIHSGVPYKTGDLLVFEDVALDDIGHLQIIWVSSEVYVMVELPHHVEIQAQKVAFDLGEVTLKDNSATLFANYSDLTCSVKLPSGEEVAVLDNKFVAEEKGNYRVSYQATNADGKKVLGSYFIRCGYEAKEFGMMWNFDDPTIVENDPQEADNGAYWVNHYEEFEGEKGVVEVVSNYNDYVWEANFLKAGKSLLEKVPADADTLFIKVKGETNFDLTLYAAYTNAIHGDTLVCYSYAVTTEWQTIAITGDNFQHFITYFNSYKNGLAMFLPNSVTMYMSEFYVGMIGEAVPESEVVNATQVTIADNAATLGYEKLSYSVSKANGTPVVVVNGNFTADEEGVYVVSYEGLVNNTPVIGSYTILVVNVSNGDWTPVASDWGKQGDAAYDNISVLPGVGYRVECNNSACHTRVPSLKAYMQANGLTTVTIKIYCVTNVALGSTLHGHTDTVNYGPGQVVVFEDVAIFEADYYIQSVWSAMTYYVVIDLGI